MINSPSPYGNIIADGSIVNAKLANGTIETAKLASTYGIQIGSITLGAPATSFDFTSLDINTDHAYRIVMNLSNNAAADANISVAINGDTTATNYYRQIMYADNAAVGGSRGNDNQIGNMGASCAFPMVLDILMSPDGIVFIYSPSSKYLGANLKIYKWFAHKVAAVANVTQITINSTQSWKTGSTAILYAFR